MEIRLENAYIVQNLPEFGIDAGVPDVVEVDAKTPYDAVRQFFLDHKSDLKLGMLVRVGDEWHRVEVKMENFEFWRTEKLNF